MVENNLDYIIFDNQKIYLELGKLNLNLKGILEIGQIENLNNLTYLTELDVQHNKLFILKSFGNHQYLKKLQFNDNKIEKIEILEGLENLEELCLSNNKLSEISGLEKLVNLRKLDIYNNEIIEIKGLDNLLNLEELILSKNKIEGIKGLDKLRNLKILVLSDNKISKIKGLDKLNNLKELYLGNNNIEEIKGLNELINIETLDLRNNNISKISGLNNLKKLRYLKLAGNKEIHSLIDKIGGFGTNFVNFPYNYVKYCRNEYVIFQNEFFFVADRPENLIGFNYNKNFKQNLYEVRINELERFLSSRLKPELQILKCVFINDGVYVGGNSAGINFLDKNAGWILVSVPKEKKEDVDAKIISFVDKMDKIYSRKWDSIYVLSSDSDIVNYFLAHFQDTSSTSLFFITDKEDYNLHSNISLRRYEQTEFEINIYYRINQKERLD